MNHVGYLLFWITVHTLLNAKALSTLLAFANVGRRGQSTLSKSATSGDSQILDARYAPADIEAFCSRNASFVSDDAAQVRDRSETAREVG